VTGSSEGLAGGLLFMVHKGRYVTLLALSTGAENDHLANIPVTYMALQEQTPEH
jgi:hypothetical protein